MCRVRRGGGGGGGGGRQWCDVVSLVLCSMFYTPQFVPVIIPTVVCSS